MISDEAFLNGLDDRDAACDGRLEVNRHAVFLREFEKFLAAFR